MNSTKKLILSAALTILLPFALTAQNAVQMPQVQKIGKLKPADMTAAKSRLLKQER